MPSLTDHLSQPKAHLFTLREENYRIIQIQSLPEFRILGQLNVGKKLYELSECVTVNRAEYVYTFQECPPPPNF